MGRGEMLLLRVGQMIYNPGRREEGSVRMVARCSAGRHSRGSHTTMAPAAHRAVELFF
jgi:hypothetical protein